jgi:hypothetical protein
MTREDILRIARQAGIGQTGLWFSCVEEELERFTKLVAAAERNKEDQKSEKYFCPVCNRQEMVRAKFDEESG